MKTNATHYILVGYTFLLFVIAIFLTAIIIQTPSQLKVDWPEEIRAAKPGDTLIINKIYNNTVYLGFTGQHL